MLFYVMAASSATNSVKEFSVQHILRNTGYSVLFG